MDIIMNLYEYTSLHASALGSLSVNILPKVVQFKYIYQKRKEKKEKVVSYGTLENKILEAS